jgi:hypothetical protein
MVDISTPTLNSDIPPIIRRVAISIERKAHILNGINIKYNEAIIKKNGNTDIADSFTFSQYSLK